MTKRYVIIIGAPKCGTTTVAAWLGAQADAVLAQQKETLYFTDYATRHWTGPGAGFSGKIPRSRAAFEAEFSADPAASLRIEASTDNLSCAAAAENIARFIETEGVQDFWIVALLRDPIDRIVSEFEHTLRMGWQSGRLMASLQAEPDRVEKGWHPLFAHIARTRYASQLAQYREIFGDRLVIVDFHKLGDPDERARLLQKIGCTDSEAASELPKLNQRNVVSRPGAKRWIRNSSLAEWTRPLVPKTLRPAVRRLLTGSPTQRYVPRADEVDFITAALRDEIAACLETNDIPTENWREDLRASV